MLRVTILCYDGFQILDATGPAAAFEMAGHFGAPYAVVMAGSTPQVRSSGGITIATVPLAAAAECDILLVPGSDDAWRTRWPETLTSLVQAAARDGRRVASVCSGTFLLATAGLLAGRRATTHWAAASILQRRYPEITVDPDSIYVEDRGIWTSAGVTAGIDLALAMIARDHGEDIARKVARKMVVYYRRPGTQSQHSALLDLVTPDNRFAPLLAWARGRLAEPLGVERLAAEAALSVRQFTRAFTEATGVPPAKAIERLRVEEARSMIEAGASSLDLVARRTGFGNGERMRRSFVRITGQPPLALRPRLSSGSDAQHI